MATELDAVSKAITKDKALWLMGCPADDEKGIAATDGLVQMVEAISQKFQENMEKIQCRGEVTLKQPGDKFAEYAIEIKVSFRDVAQVLTLDAHKHSGGEKSVSTMMYLISLQPKKPSPFRLVDEINQAMDPINERRIWEQVVSASAERNSPQYFLITPKLLSNLTYSDSVCVHVVFNGYYNLNQSEWQANSGFIRHDDKELLQGAREGSAAGGKENSVEEQDW